MLFMVTNRRFQAGRYIDEEKPNFKFDYQSGYNGQARGADGFDSNAKKVFQQRLLAELHRLRDVEGVGTPKVGIYLHGYNNDYQESLDEIVDLERCLTPEIGYAPIIIGFSWPSTGYFTHYLSDREEARQSVGAFTRFLLEMNRFLEANERQCFSTTYCIAHSMGNYLLRKGMEYLSDAMGTPVGRMLFAETIMLAPDLAAHDIELDGKGQYIAEFSRRVHVYYSRHDRALKASSAKRFGGRRLGRHGAMDYENLKENVVVINAQNFANSDAVKEAGLTIRTGDEVSVHSSHRYHPRIVADIVQVMSSVDRDMIAGRQAVIDEDMGVQGNHYELI